MVSQPLKGLTLEILKDIIKSSKFQIIIIVSSLHPSDFGLEEEYFDKLKDDCLIWMGNVVSERDINDKILGFCL
jgi:hypothetical protein